MKLASAAEDLDSVQPSAANGSNPRRKPLRQRVHAGAPQHSPKRYCGAEVTGNDGATMTAGCVAVAAAVDADAAAAGVRTGATGAAAIASLRAAGDGLARGDAFTSEAALAAGDAPAAAEVG